MFHGSGTRPTHSGHIAEQHRKPGFSTGSAAHAQDAANGKGDPHESFAKFALGAALMAGAATAIASPASARMFVGVGAPVYGGAPVCDPYSSYYNPNYCGYGAAYVDAPVFGFGFGGWGDGWRGGWHDRGFHDGGWRGGFHGGGWRGGFHDGDFRDGGFHGGSGFHGGGDFHGGHR